MAQLSIRKAILYAVNAVISDPGHFVKLCLIWIAVYLAIIIIGIECLACATLILPYWQYTLYILLAVAAVFTGFLTSKLLLNFHDYGARSLSLGYIFKLLSAGLVFKLFLAFLVYTLLFTAGLILLIIPGIFIAIRLGFALLRLMDTNCSVPEAFRKSYEITKGNFWRLCGLVILMNCLMYLIITVPVALLMYIHAYRQLQPAGK